MFKNVMTHSVDFVPWWMRDLIKKIPIVSGLQRLIFDKFLSEKEFIYEINAGPAKGLNFPIKLPEDKLIWTGTWEKDISEVIAANVREGLASFDIGSHRGFMAGIMALAGASKVYCFEPNPENLEHLSILHKLNDQLKLDVLPYAVSDKDGEAEFSLMPESSMGKLSESSFQPEAEKNTSINVKVRTIDSLLNGEEVETPGFIKIDVEGAELLVLQGAKETIEKYSPAFVVELHSFSLAHECIEFLLDYGYRTQIIQRDINLDDEASFKVCHLLARKTV